MAWPRSPDAGAGGNPRTPSCTRSSRTVERRTGGPRCVGAPPPRRSRDAGSHRVRASEQYVEQAACRGPPAWGGLDPAPSAASFLGKRRCLWSTLANATRGLTNMLIHNPYLHISSCRRILIAKILILAAVSTCTSCVVTHFPGYMLAYFVEGAGSEVRVRTSGDGVTWSGATLATSDLVDRLPDDTPHLIGAATDPSGLVRTVVIADEHRYHVWQGIGPVWGFYSGFGSISDWYPPRAELCVRFASSKYTFAASSQDFLLPPTTQTSGFWPVGV